MTIPEAAQLVLQASAMAEGGEVFVLDMGPPVKIIDLAKRMIQLSGKTYSNGTENFGSIELRITGLRPGEKLYEELLIDRNVLPSKHPAIMRALERSIETEQLSVELGALHRACDSGSLHEIRTILGRLVENFPVTSVDSSSNQQ